jgi:hypothetical protein
MERMGWRGKKTEYNSGGEAILIFKLLDAHVEDPCVLGLSV